MVLKPNVQPIEVPFSLVESGANTFTTATINLPVNINSNLVFDLDHIALEGMFINDPAAAGIVSNEWCLSLDVQTATLTFANQNLIAKRLAGSGASAANIGHALMVEDLHMDTQGRANFISKDVVSQSIEGTNQGVANTVNGRLIGSLEKLSVTQVAQLVISQL